MLRIVCICFCFFYAASTAIAEERKNFSIDDVIQGFKDNKLFYYEVHFVNEKYSKTFNKCLNSKPADFDWLKQNCKKNPELVNAFYCSSDNQMSFALFIYETNEKCEEVRKPMKDKMDAMK